MSFNFIIFPLIIILFASTVQGSLGFGFSLLAVPLLSFFLPLSTIVPIIVIFSLFINIAVVITTYKNIKIKEIWILILFGIVGIPFGVYGLKNFNADILKTVIGFLIILTSIFLFTGIKINLKNKHISLSITGFISGVLNGSISMSGPPVVLFLSNENYDKDTFRSNLAFYGIITNIITIAAFYQNRLLTKEVISYSLYLLTALIAGSITGIFLSKIIKEDYFKKIVLIVLIIMGISTAIKSISAVIYRLYNF